MHANGIIIRLRPYTSWSPRLGNGRWPIRVEEVLLLHVEFYGTGKFRLTKELEISYHEQSR